MSENIPSPMEKKLVIDSRIEQISEVEKVIDELSEDLQLHSDIYGNLLIATIEGVNNAIVHGNKFDDSKKVVIHFIIENTQIFVHINDEGSGFDYSSVPDPTKPENIENFHGRGIFLMKNLADNIEFCDSGKLVKLSFKF